MLFCARAFALQNGKTWAVKFYALLRRSWLCFGKKFLCPAAALANFVLAVFARSFELDGIRDYKLFWGNRIVLARSLPRGLLLLS